MWRPGSTMTMSTDRKASVKLAALSIVLAGIPLVALGWLGGRLLAQDRALESQWRRERLENAATLLTRELDRSLAAWTRCSCRLLRVRRSSCRRPASS